MPFPDAAVCSLIGMWAQTWAPNGNSGNRLISGLEPLKDSNFDLVMSHRAGYKFDTSV